jgi:hypothetical protein
MPCRTKLQHMQRGKKAVHLECPRKGLRNRKEGKRIAESMNAYLPQAVERELEQRRRTESLVAEMAEEMIEDDDFGDISTEGISPLEAEIERLQEENERLQEQVGSIVTERVWPLEAENERLQEETERKTCETLEQLKRQKERFEEEIERIIEESVIPLGEENQRLAEELERCHQATLSHIEMARKRFEDEVATFLAERLGPLEAANQRLQELEEESRDSFFFLIVGLKPYLSDMGCPL